MIIREFRNSDYDSVLKLWDEAKLPYKPKGRDSIERIGSELQKRTSIFLIAEINGEIAGTILATHDGRRGWLNRLAVARTYRHQHIARELVSEAERKINELGIEIIACLIENWNTDSMEVIQKLGYLPSEVKYFSKRKSSDT